MEDRPIVQGRTSPVDASQNSHPCNVGELMNAQRRYQSFQIINKVYMTMNLTPIFQELRQPKKNHVIVGRTYHFSGFLEHPNYMSYETFHQSLSFKNAPKNHQNLQKNES